MLAPTSSATTDWPSSWSAELEVEILNTPFGTRLGQRRHHGPLRIQRPFFPEGPEVLHLYLLHPPGGVVGGDHLNTRIDTRFDAHALLTTPAAQKIYRSLGSTSLVQTELHAEAGAKLEWLPSETIVYDGAVAQSDLRVFLDPAASFIGWEVICLGRPASNSPFATGKVTFSTEVTIGNRLELSERFEIDGSSDVLNASWGLAGNVCMGTLICTSKCTDALEQLGVSIRDSLESSYPTCASVTHLGPLSVLRVQGASAQSVNRVLAQAWRIARPLLLGQNAHAPRIWST